MAYFWGTIKSNELQMQTGLNVAIPDAINEQQEKYKGCGAFSPACNLKRF